MATSHRMSPRTTPITVGGRALLARVSRCHFQAEAADALLTRAVERLGLSGRGRTRVARVGRTIAALAASDAVLPEHVGEGLSHRTPDELA
jgi:predicted ATPase with chaperone activity